MKWPIRGPIEIRYDIVAARAFTGDTALVSSTFTREQADAMRDLLQGTQYPNHSPQALYVRQRPIDLGEQGATR